MTQQTSAIHGKAEPSIRATGMSESSSPPVDGRANPTDKTIFISPPQCRIMSKTAVDQSQVVTHQDVASDAIIRQLREIHNRIPVEDIDHAEFWGQVDIQRDGCWLWRGIRTAHGGYGLFILNSSQYRAHRVAYELATGKRLGSLCALHSCDTPACVRPSHIHPGTNALNQHEKAERGRAFRGERHHFAKLTEAQVREIRAAGQTDWAFCQSAAPKYGVSPVTIMWVVRRRTWKHTA